MGTRTVAIYAATGFFLVLATFAGILCGFTHGSARAWWVAIDCFAVLAAFVLPLSNQYRRDAEALELEAYAIDLATAMQDALVPIVGQLGRIAQAPSPAERGQLCEQVVPMVLGSAAQLIGSDRVRASWFELEPGPPRAVHPVLHIGRPDAPRTHFVENTVEGREVFRMIELNLDRFCYDVDEEPPPGWDPTTPHDYRTFLTVPVVAGGTAYGMLSVDSETPGDLDGSDAPLLRLLAGLLADALALAA